MISQENQHSAEFYGGQKSFLAGDNRGKPGGFFAGMCKELRFGIRPKTRDEVIQLEEQTTRRVLLTDTTLFSCRDLKAQQVNRRGE